MSAPVLQNLSKDARDREVEGMRAWLVQIRRSLDINGIGDHELPDVPAIEAMTTGEVCDGIDAEYEGGVAQFLADSFAEEGFESA